MWPTASTACFWRRCKRKRKSHISLMAPASVERATTEPKREALSRVASRESQVASRESSRPPNRGASQRVDRVNARLNRRRFASIHANVIVSIAATVVAKLARPSRAPKIDEWHSTSKSLASFLSPLFPQSLHAQTNLGCECPEVSVSFRVRLSVYKATT